jgi:hypothetical protein
VAGGSPNKPAGTNTKHSKKETENVKATKSKQGEVPNISTGIISQGPCSIAQVGGTENQATGGNCQIANPNKPVVTYDFNGTKRTIPVPGHLEIDDSEVTTFEKMRGYINAREWKRLADLAEETMKRVPDWPTPYFAAGEAYACLNNQAKSMQYLRNFKEKADEGTTYTGAVSDSDKILNHAITPQVCTSKE